MRKGEDIIKKKLETVAMISQVHIRVKSDQVLHIKYV